MVIYGEDPCPEGKDGEIVVCSRQPERDRYRLPKTFRKTDGQVEKSWSGQASAASDAGNAGIGSCSPVGAGGATGCNPQIMRTATQRRKQDRDEKEVLAEAIPSPIHRSAARRRHGGAPAGLREGQQGVIKNN